MTDAANVGYGKSNYVVNRWVLGPSSTVDNDMAPSTNTLAMVTDGLSNTIMLGEKEMVDNPGGIWSWRRHL